MYTKLYTKFYHKPVTIMAQDHSESRSFTYKKKKYHFGFKI